MRSRDEVLIVRFMRNETFTLEEGEDLRDAVRGMADDLMATERQRDEYHAMWTKETLAKRELADRIRELEAQLTLPPIREKFVRVSDELVAELKAAPSKPVTVAIVEDGNELHMTFTESQQASSEPVAWASYHDGCDRPWTVDLVKREPWGVSAGTRIVPLYAHPSAAGVTVTEDDEKITMTVGPVTEAEAVAALKRHGWTEQSSLFGSFRSLVAPEPAASEGASE